MDAIALLKTFSQYNSWINSHILQKMQEAAPHAAARPQYAIFSHMIDILNHVFVLDLIWLRRYQQHFNNTVCNRIFQSLSQYSHSVQMETIMYRDLQEFSCHRKNLDDILHAFISQLTVLDLSMPIHFMSMAEQQECVGKLGELLLHQLNHQSSHRGDVLSSAAVLAMPIGNSDMLAVLQLMPSKAENAIA